MEIAAIAVFMGAAWWWHRPKTWRVPTYEEAFPLDLQEVEETEENKVDRVVVEMTPEGKVKMRRTGDVFEYWAPRAMVYRYLEPVARKHVLVYGGNYTKLERATEKEVSANAEGKNGVFASFKTYGKRREVCKEINQYRWLGKEEVKMLRVEPKRVSFADFKNKN